MKVKAFLLSAAATHSTTTAACRPRVLPLVLATLLELVRLLLLLLLLRQSSKKVGLLLAHLPDCLLGALLFDLLLFQCLLLVKS